MMKLVLLLTAACLLVLTNGAKHQDDVNPNDDVVNPDDDLVNPDDDLMRKEDDEATRQNAMSPDAEVNVEVKSDHDPGTTRTESGHDVIRDQVEERKAKSAGDGMISEKEIESTEDTLMMEDDDVEERGADQVQRGWWTKK